MTGNLAPGERTVQLSSSPEKNNANHVNQGTTVLSSISQQLQGYVMQVFSAIMDLTNNNLLVETGVMQVFVQLDDTAHKVIH